MTGEAINQGAGGGDSSRSVDSYFDFKVLPDEPARQPGLNFDNHASLLAGMIRNSRAASVIGIFGSWGTGKTTLMQRIEKILTSDENVVTVWFTAWRYEKERHLIVPLLDVLSETLDARAYRARAYPLDPREHKRRWVVRRRNRASDSQGWANDAAVIFSKAGQAFLAGLSLSAGLPGVRATISPGDMIEAIKAGKDRRGPLSAYHAGFVMLREAIYRLSAGGTRRLVVFVDDLDRCLPLNALDLLESMKLCFDVEGCTFVVGLDPEMVMSAIEMRFGVASETNQLRSHSGVGFVNKIFQIPFAMPMISARQLPSYLEAIEAESGFGDTQLADFRDKVRPHFARLQRDGPINLREIKRLINFYTLQLKMLSPRLGEALDPHVVLALLCMSNRRDWSSIYDQLVADPAMFQFAMRHALGGGEWPSFVWLSGTRVALSRDFIKYLCGYASPLLRVENLQWYVSAAESSWSIDPSVLEARTLVSRLRVQLDQLSGGRLLLADATREIPVELDRCHMLVRSLRGLRGRPLALREEILSMVSELEERARELAPTGNAEDSQRKESPTFVTAWVGDTAAVLDRLDAGLRELHRSMNIGAQ